MMWVLLFAHFTGKKERPREGKQLAGGYASRSSGAGILKHAVNPGTTFQPLYTLPPKFLL